MPLKAGDRVLVGETELLGPAVPGAGLRVSVHLDNDRGDVGRLVEAVRAELGGR